jgi:hypothetical protein
MGPRSDSVRLGSVADPHLQPDTEGSRRGDLIINAAWLLGLALMICPAGRAGAQDAALPSYLRDRGTGIPASVFGTYLEPHQLLIYPFFAYSKDDNREYQPAKLGFGLNADFQGRFRSSEGLIFIGYGLSSKVALEFEAAYITAHLDKDPTDPSSMPARISEKGIADVEAQIRYRPLTETAHRPEIYTFLELTPATNRDKVLISEPDWDVKPGFGVVKGFPFGTLQLKFTGEWNREAGNPDLGEVAIEYLKRVSPALRFNLAIEGGETGAPDEFELIGGLRWEISKHAWLKLDNSIGLSPKATDWGPQVGVQFTLPR